MSVKVDTTLDEDNRPVIKLTLYNGDVTRFNEAKESWALKMRNR